MSGTFPNQPKWPSGLASCRIRGQVVLSDGTVPTGDDAAMRFTPSLREWVGVVLNPDGLKRVIGTRSITVALTNGLLDVVLPASDDPNQAPTNWTYLVEEGWSGNSYTIRAPGGQVLDLADLTAVVEFRGSPNLSVEADTDVYDGGFL